MTQCITIIVILFYAVTISSPTPSQVFDGFLLEAIRADQRTIISGSFAAPNGTQTIQCQDVSGGGVSLAISA